MKYKISELATLLNVTTNTIRRYEKMGYIRSKRSENSNYRYYNEDDLSTFMNVRLLRKYGFTHIEIGNMKNSDMAGLISEYEKRMKEFDEQISYLTNLRHRLKDDLVLMKKADEMKQLCYIRDCNALSYVLYQSGDKILTEPQRITAIQDYLYSSPEVVQMYLIRQEDVEKDCIVLNAGWAMKTAHLDRYQIKENEYTERYEQRKSLISVAKFPVNKERNVKDDLLKEPTKYMKDHNLKMNGDIIGIIIANVIEDGQEMQYVLIGVPITEV
ncbi:MerR family transcriptional regulator [Paenibacillus silviterrae]|uniref:MerR family transcriptional regulator n=1 Tax=Paenibacillus silviterrae TaxID=3242194 RepID=UPI002542CC5E|nr:MerR family transcriptional regulator [Paenibacillus chinjuensis]